MLFISFLALELTNSFFWKWAKQYSHNSFLVFVICHEKIIVHCTGQRRWRPGTHCHKRSPHIKERRCSDKCSQVELELNHFCLIRFCRDLYKGYEKTGESKNMKIKKFCKKSAHVYIPTGILIFVIIYWLIGLKNAQYI